MLTPELESLSALGRSLTGARNRGIIDPTQYARAAGTLAVAMLTGSMEMDAYAGIHWILGQMIEAAFTSPGKAKQPDLDKHMETVGRMWNYVGPEGDRLRQADAVFQRIFELENASFSKNPRLTAPLSCKPLEVGTLLRKGGVAVISAGGKPIANPTKIALSDKREGETRMHIEIGWGERRMNLLFLE